MKDCYADGLFSARLILKCFAVVFGYKSDGLLLDWFFHCCCVFVFAFWVHREVLGVMLGFWLAFRSAS